MAVDELPNNSDYSSSGEGNSQSEEYRMKSIVKSMLVGSLFVGTFVEKRFVPLLKEYRHIIKISDIETNVIHCLKLSIKRIKEFYAIEKWIGFTDEGNLGSPAGCNIWTVLPEEKFGTYWFRIKGVQFYPYEVRLKVQIIRPYIQESDFNCPENSSEEMNISLTSLHEKSVIMLKNFFIQVLNLQNIIDSFIFLSLLIATLITGLGKIIHYFSEYVLKLLFITRDLIVVSTPICIAFINASTNIVFGLYRLIAHLCKRETPETVTYVMTAPQLAGHTNSIPMNALPESSGARYYQPIYSRYERQRRGVTITPLN